MTFTEKSGLLCKHLSSNLSPSAANSWCKFWHRSGLQSKLLMMNRSNLLAIFAKRMAWFEMAGNWLRFPPKESILRILCSFSQSLMLSTCLTFLFCYLWVAAAATRAKTTDWEWGTLSQWWSTNRKLIKFIIDKFHVYCSERTRISLPKKMNATALTVLWSATTLHYTVLTNASSLLTMFPISHPLYWSPYRQFT